MNQKALTGVEVVVALAVIFGAIWLVKPSLLPGASRNAAQSTAATAKVEETTNAIGAAAAASVVKIGEANGMAPISPSKDFIGQEVPFLLSRLPAPDAKSLLEAEKRRSAVMEGRLQEAQALYESAAKAAAKLQTERDEAIAARRTVDLKLETAAAAEHARTMQFIGAVVILLIVSAAFLYIKIYHISPSTLGVMAAEIRAGGSPIQVMTDNLAPRQYASVQKAAKLATPLVDRKPA